MRKLMSRPEGFTLIELMIVILIIAILVAIAVPVYLSAKKNAEKRTCQANLRTVDGAIQAYEAMSANGDYPTTTADLVEPGTKCLKSTPTCPAGSGSDHTYKWIVGSPPEISCPFVTGHSI